MIVLIGAVALIGLMIAAGLYLWFSHRAFKTIQRDRGGYARERTSELSAKGNNGAERLVAAYPQHLKSVQGNLIRWKDGSVMRYDDGKHDKSFVQFLNEPSLKDQMTMAYSKGAKYPRQKNFDPGRARYEPFFRKMYGSTEAEVRGKLKPVYWLRGSVNSQLLVTSVNDVHKKLQAISDEIDALPADIQKHASKGVSTYKWRPIAGTNRLSPHSFGIAIDLNGDDAQYWYWDNPKAEGELKPKHQMPQEIVDIFEKHGFIWGGKFYHYDTMHFEYRPELLIDHDHSN